MSFERMKMKFFVTVILLVTCFFTGVSLAGEENTQLNEDYDNLIMLSKTTCYRCAKVSKNNKWGIYDTEYKSLRTAVIYDEIIPVGEFSLFLVTLNGKQRIKDIGNKPFDNPLPEKYDNVSLFDGTASYILKLCKDNKCSLARVTNRNVEVLSDLIYDDFRKILQEQSNGVSTGETNYRFYVAIRGNKKTLFPICDEDKQMLTDIAYKDYDDFKVTWKVKKRLLLKNYQKYTVYGKKNGSWIPLYTYKEELNSFNK